MLRSVRKLPLTRSVPPSSMSELMAQPNEAGLDTSRMPAAMLTLPVRLLNPRSARVPVPSLSNCPLPMKGLLTVSVEVSATEMRPSVKTLNIRPLEMGKVVLASNVPPLRKTGP